MGLDLFNGFFKHPTRITTNLYKFECITGFLKSDKLIPQTTFMLHTLHTALN